MKSHEQACLDEDDADHDEGHHPQPEAVGDLQ
jgi:hypothetical protein